MSTSIAAGTIPRITESGPTPLSFAQQRLWFLDQLQPNSSAYNMIQIFRLKGRLNVIALEFALNEVRRRHNVLRANFDSENDQPIQIVAPFHPVSLPVVDYSNLPDDERDKACQDTISTYSRRPFNLKSDSLLRTTLLQLGPQEHVLVLAMHHIISDGWSTGLITQEITSLYGAFCQEKPSPLPELPIQYSDYARWQRDWFQGAVLEKHLSYWTKRLAGSPPLVELPTDYARPNVQTFSGGRFTKLLPPELLESLRSLGQRQHATLFMTLLAAFQILLYRLSGQDDMVIGAPIAGRGHWQTEKLIGFFVNTLALRGDLSGNPTFDELLERVRSTVLDALDYQNLPFEKLVEELQPARSLSHTPLVQVMLNVFILENPGVDIPGLRIEDLTPPNVDSKFDVNLYVLRESKGVRLDLIYNTDLFEAARMEEMLNQFFHLLEQIVAAPGKKIDSFSLITEKSSRFLPDPTATLPELEFPPVKSEFLLRVKESPKRIAVTQTGRSWTYEELSSATDCIAQILLTRGLRHKEVVAVLGPRSFGLIASIVGVFTSGGVLFAIDRDLPTNRQRVMLTEARAKYLLYVGQWREQDDWLHAIPDLKIIAVRKEDGVRLKNRDIPLPGISPDDPAYIFFTSGTTGTPKGVLGCQKGLSQFLAWQKNTFNIGSDDRCAQLTNLSFEVVLRDIFLPLVSGAALCLPDEDIDSASDRVLPWMDREGITIFHAVPSLAQTWLAPVPDGVTLRTLRWAIFGGEPLTETFVQRWREALPQSGEIVNFYGPAETTLAKCFHIIPNKTAYGIQRLGKPLPQTQALVLNGNRQLCGVGEPGEIVIRTPYRTLGYINAPEQQLKRFVKNPFRDDPSDEIYYTGDCGSYRADGALEFLGRLDDQVKIRGVRIEPAEITATLAQHPKVESCFVTACKDTYGENALAAYVVGSDGVTSGDLRGFLGEHLPAVMLPSVFVFLDALPITRNGKVDRRALPTANLLKTDSQGVFVAPRTPTEQTLANIWCRLLKLEQVSVHDDFFELGGHSLIATQLVSQIRQELAVELPLRTIFSRPTIESLALQLLEQRAGASNSAEFEALLAEVESLSDESVEESGSAMLHFHCPVTKSPLFGKRHCNLIILINERFETASFEKVCQYVRDFDSTINAVVMADSVSKNHSLPVLPTLTFSPAVTRYPGSQAGRVFSGYPLSKNEEYTSLVKAGIQVPNWVLVTEKLMPDLLAFDDYVVRKPNYGGMSADVVLMPKNRVRWKPITTWAAGTSDSMIVQQFIYTGVRPVTYRVNTLFGRVLYSVKQIAGEDQPPLPAVGHLPDPNMQEGYAISSWGPGCRTELNFDEEIIRVAERAHAAFPEIPLLGFDIIREANSGKVYVIEANAIGYTWRFDTGMVTDDGFPVDEQFDGPRKAAFILAEKTQECAS